MEATREQQPLVANAASVAAAPIARDPEELEGSLLLPTARVVSERFDAQGIQTAATPTVATAVSTTYFEYDDYDQVKEESDDIAKSEEGATAPAPAVLQQAVALPSYDEFSRNSLRNNNQLTRAQRDGIIQSEQETQHILKANRETNAINYHTKQQVKEANRAANQTQQKEDKGYVQTVATMPPLKPAPPVPAKAPEFYKGTYSADYKTADYETGQYDTGDYKTADYKSVYES